MDKGKINFGKDYVVLELNEIRVRLVPMQKRDISQYETFNKELQEKSGERTDGYIQREIQERQGESCTNCED